MLLIHFCLNQFLSLPWLCNMVGCLLRKKRHNDFLIDTMACNEKYGLCRTWKQTLCFINVQHAFNHQFIVYGLQFEPCKKRLPRKLQTFTMRKLTFSFLNVKKNSYVNGFHSMACCVYKSRFLDSILINVVFADVHPLNKFDETKTKWIQNRFSKGSKWLLVIKKHCHFAMPFSTVHMK